MINTSIIIPSYKSEKTIELCLNSIFNQKTNIKYEVIVVDSSPNNSVDNIIKKYPKVKFIKLKQKTLPGIARNIGAKKISGKVLVFLDSDIVLESNVLEEIWKYHKKGYKIFSGSLELARHPGFSWTAAIKHYFFHHEYQKIRKKKQRNNLSSSLLVFEKELFCKSGGFKDLPQGEDTELTKRLARKRIKLFFIPNIIGYVIHDDSFTDVLKKVFNSGFYSYFINYRNSVFEKKLFLIFFLPLLTFTKITRINLRNIIYNGLKGGFIGLLISPILYFCGIVWMIGMYNAILSNKSSRNLLRYLIYDS